MRRRVAVTLQQTRRRERRQIVPADVGFGLDWRNDLWEFRCHRYQTDGDEESAEEESKSPHVSLSAVLSSWLRYRSNFARREETSQCYAIVWRSGK